MNTYDSLKSDLTNLGLCGNETVIIHSSMKKIGNTEGGADTVLQVLCDFFERDGLLVFPTHTWGFIENDCYLYNPKTSKTNLGLLPSLFLERKNVYRSIHPTHSVCAFGKGAKEFVKDSLPQHTYCPKGSCYEKLYNMNAKVLLLGVTLSSCTYFHYIEESLFDKVPPYYSTCANCSVEMPDGSVVNNKVYISPVDTSKQFDRAFDRVLSEKSTKTGMFGKANCILIDCNKIFPVIEAMIKDDPQVFMP